MGAGVLLSYCLSSPARVLELHDDCADGAQAQVIVAPSSCTGALHPAGEHHNKEGL